MPLLPIFDQREKLQGQAGLHAFIIGVSEYTNLPEPGERGLEQHLGLTKLSSAALSGWRIYQWLVKRKDFLAVPLASCRVLLSPSAKELAAELNLSTFQDLPTLDNVRESADSWRQDLASSKEAIGLFYFAGHGVQRRRRDHVLLLQDFGKSPGPLLEHAIETNNLISGLAPSEKFPQIARAQLYFLDACRIKPSLLDRYEALEASSVWDIAKLTAVPDDPARLIVYTTVPGALAFGRAGEQTIFSRALIECLEKDAAREQDAEMTGWAVSAQSLSERLQSKIDAINDILGGNQVVEFGSVPARELILNRLESPPMVNVELQVEPLAALDCTAVSVLNPIDGPVWNLPAPMNPHPYRGDVAGGLYQLIADIGVHTPQWMPFRTFVKASPPASYWRVKIRENTVGPGKKIS